MTKKLMGIQAVKNVVGVSESTIIRLEKRHLFPRKVKIPGSRRSMYLEDEILQYVEGLRAKRDASKSYSIPYTTTWRSAK